LRADTSPCEFVTEARRVPRVRLQE